MNEKERKRIDMRRARAENPEKFRARERRWKSQNPEFLIWRAIKTRCLNAKHPTFARYGGRGVTICPEWASSYGAFLEAMGRRPSPLHSVDRIDNARGYEPGNCRWASKKEQARNRCDNRLVVIFGEAKCVTAWSEDSRAAVGLAAFRSRIHAGWDPERALVTPAAKGVKQHA